jgi:glucan phosphoethanolaminetransferase (alkaline phosphatase superfamily)
MIGIWMVFTGFDLFGVRDSAFFLEHIKSPRFLVNYLSSSLAFLGLLILIRQYLVHGMKKRLLAFLILFLPLAVQLSYFAVYRKFVSSFGFRAFSEDPGMVFDLWLENIQGVKTVFAFVLVWAVIWGLGQIKCGFHKVTRIAACFIIVVVTSLMTFSWYSVPVFQNSVLAYSGSFLEMTKQKTYASFKIDKPVITPEKTAKKLPDIIYVIGESTVLSHMSLFGYPRKTTPGLDRLERENKIVTFPNCVSIGLQTRLSVPYMLAGLQGIDPKGYFYTCPTIFNYAKARGYATALVTAQDFSWGRLTDILLDKDVDEFQNGTAFDANLSVHKGADDLVVLEKGVMPWIDKAKQPFLLVVQMDGSHYPYNEHSDPSHKRFLPETEPNCINAFDNSVLVTDLFLTRLIEKIRKDKPGAWVIFSPDHGQNLGGENGFFNDQFSESVIHNPLIVSAPQEGLKAVAKNRNAPLSQADIVPTLLELMDLKPVKPIDGLSLLGPVPENRLRVCSTYMPTFHNVPESVLVFPDLSYYFVDLNRKSVLLKDGKTQARFDDLEPRFKEPFLRRM